MLNKELLDLLACPSCKGDLEYDAEKSILICKNRHCKTCGMPVDNDGKCLGTECGDISDNFVALNYHVEDDIPNMLIYEAEKVPLNR